jgi:acetylornithine deacetylase/succinyl-diaminopimelate desuccinylase-like protein
MKRLLEWSKRHPKRARLLLYAAPFVLFFGASNLIAFLNDLGRGFDWIGTDFLDYEEVRLFQEYLRIDTSSSTGNEIPGAEFLARVLEKEGIPAHIERIGTRNAAVWASLEGRQKQPLVLHNHIDVEAPRTPESWRFPPYSGTIDGPFIYSKGAFDMKSYTIAQLMTMLRLKRDGRALDRSLMFLATGDEETGSHLGTAWLLRHHPEWRSHFWGVLTEGGAIEMVELDHFKYWGTEFAQKRIVRVVVCDASQERLKDLSADLQDRESERRIIPEIEEFFSRYGPARARDETRRLLSDPKNLLNAIKSFPVDVDITMITPYHEAMMRDELWVDPLLVDPEGGFRLRLVLELLPDRSTEDALQILIGDQLKGFTFMVEELNETSPSSPTSHPIFQTIDRHLAESHPEGPHGPLFVPFSMSDSRYFRAVGIPSYGFSPFKILSSTGITMKGVNERMALPGFLEGVELYHDVVVEIVASDN